MTSARLITLFGFGIIAACAAGTESERASNGALAASNGLPCDVDAVLEQSCRGCHAAEPVFGAPMPLVTRDDLVAPAHSDPTKKVYELVKARVHASSRPMPPPPNEALSPTALGALDSWIAAGAPAASPVESCGGTPTHPSTGLSCTPDTHIVPSHGFAMPETSDNEYVCYGVDVTTANKRQVIAMGTKVDNANILHHALVFTSPTGMGSEPHSCSPAADPSWRMVYGWAPGGRSFELPPEAGFPLEGTTHYVVQLHYNNVLHRPNQVDASGFDFCTTNELRPNDADTLVLGAVNFQIPPRTRFERTCDFPSPNVGDLHIMGALEHMHTIGTQITSTDETTGVTLGSRPSWDFQNQAFEPISTVVHPGDKLRTHCEWTNTTDTMVSYGPHTEDEMCFTFLLYWPRITAGSWNPWIPSFAGHCE